VALILLACVPTKSPVDTATTIPLLRPTIGIASATPTNQDASSTPSPLPELPIVYYYFIAIMSNTYPAGSVVILPDELVLGPTLSKISRTHDTVTDISSALQAMLNDPRNAWISSDVSITNITFNDGAANVALHGEYFGVGDIVLIAARYQILLTVFSESSVETAIITINDKNIANLGRSDPFEVHPADYTYTRVEIETFLAENAYKAP
jgi:hypothetical protein